VMISMTQPTSSSVSADVSGSRGMCGAQHPGMISLAGSLVRPIWRAFAREKQWQAAFAQVLAMGIRLSSEDSRRCPALREMRGTCHHLKLKKRILMAPPQLYLLIVSPASPAILARFCGAR